MFLVVVCVPLFPIKVPQNSFSIHCFEVILMVECFEVNF